MSFLNVLTQTLSGPSAHNTINRPIKQTYQADLSGRPIQQAHKTGLWNRPVDARAGEIMKFERWSIRARLFTGFGVVLLALVALSVIAILQVQNVRERLDSIIDGNGVKERYAINFRGSVHDRSIALRDVILVDPSELPAVVGRIKKLKGDYGESAQPLEGVFLQGDNATPEEKSIYAHIKAAQVRGDPLIDRVIALQESGKTDEARRLLLDTARPALVEWLAAVNTMIDYEESQSADEGDQARSISAKFTLLMAGLAAIACALTVGVAWFVSRNVARTLGADPRDMIAFAEAIREGDLASPSPIRDDDRDSVMATVTQMRNSLAQLVERVRGAVDGVVLASRDIADGTADLGTRTNSQAAALEQATNALGEFDESVSANATNAGHANKLANEASLTAGGGGESVGRVVETMTGIRTSSQRIGEIVSVIDSIAFQTNILAINAAVEAAQAGTHGKGFAVVASEVRVLARRSAEAAKEIKTLIEESNARVGEGGRLADIAGSTIEEVIASSRNVTSIMSEINDACVQQAYSIGELRDMIRHVESSTQQNVALVEQSGAATALLISQADSLLEAVSVFKLASA
ncbi:methyl-accepting chemotaxis protein [Pararobbsia alpina]|uniref:methyl-accepting chemotaxis protein n=1 Tax=Pararobbsia alpina TaxID=621374 RepID=UPI0039A6A93D